MTKTIGNVLGAVVSVIRYAPFGPVGLIVATAGVLLAKSLVSGSPSQPPQTTESSRKSAVPTRKRYYGQGRLYGDWLLFSYKADGTPVDVWAFHDGQMNAVTQVYLNDDKVTIAGGVVQAFPDKRYQDNRLLAGYNLGLPTETAFAAVVGSLPGIWTTDHRGDGIVTGYLIKQLTKSEKFLETYPNGDDIQMSLAGQWSRVFDPRDGAQAADDRSTWRYTSATPGAPNPGENPVAAFLHYKLTQRGIDFDTQILPQIAKWTAALNDCDDAQALAVGGTEPRYRLSMGYDATDDPASIEAAFMATFDGWYCENNRGELIIYSGRYYPPTKSIGPDQIVDYSLQRHVEAENAVNEVTITYVSAEHDYTTPDAEAWRDEAAISASGREPVTVALGAQIPSPTQGRRLAKRKMIRANAPFRGTVSTTYGGREILGERFIHLRIEEAGAVFYDGPAEIVGSPERDMQTGGVRFEWVAASPDIDDWDPETEDGNGAPVGENPEIEPLETPTITSAAVELVDIGAKVSLDVDAPARDDLVWRLRWKLSADTNWTPVEVVDSDPGAPVLIVYGYLPLESSIDVEVSYTTGDGRTSDWSASETISTQVSWQSATIVDSGDTTVTGGVDGIYTITRTSGSTGWNAGAISTTGYAGRAVARVEATSGSDDTICGLSANPGADNNYATVQFGIWLSSGGVLKIIESGTPKSGSYGSWSDGDVFWAVQAADGTGVSYWSGPDLATATLLDSSATTLGMLYFDSSIYNVGGSVLAGLFRRPA